MSTVLDILGSSVIGSLLLLALIGLLFSVTDSNYILNRSLVAQQKADLMVDILTNDFNKAGIAVPDTVNPVITADSVTFSFLGDVDGSGVPDSVSLVVQEIADSSGGVFCSIKRRVNTGVVDEYTFKNVSARFRYYDSNSSMTTIPGNICSVETSLVTEDNIEYRDSKASGMMQWRVFLKNIKR
jgi:Tfp pilus assembly protein PilW